MRNKKAFSCLSVGGEKDDDTCGDEGRADAGEFMGDVCAPAEKNGVQNKNKDTLY